MTEGFKSFLLVFAPPHLSARGYLAASCENVTDEIIAEYIRDQDKDVEKGDTFESSKL